MKCTLRQFIVASAAVLTGFALPACTTAPATGVSGEPTVSLGELGPAASPWGEASALANVDADPWATENVYFLGAGDELGRQVFTRYVASIRASEYYATGVDDFTVQE